MRVGFAAAEGGDWTDRSNSNVEEGLLTAYLARGVDDFEQFIEELKSRPSPAVGEAARTGTRNAARVSRPRKSLRLGQALFAQARGARWRTGSRAKAQQDDPAHTASNQPGVKTGNPRRVVSRTTQGGAPVVARQMGIANEREGWTLLCTKDENEVGKLQPQH